MRRLKTTTYSVGDCFIFDSGMSNFIGRLVSPYGAVFKVQLIFDFTPDPLDKGGVGDIFDMKEFHVKYMRPYKLFKSKLKELL